METQEKSAGNVVAGAGASGSGVQEVLETTVAPTSPATPGRNEHVQRLLEGRINVGELSAEQRVWYVAQLIREGRSTNEMALLMDVSERTITRDRREIRRGESLEPGLGLGDELLGELQRRAFDASQKLTRMAEDERTPAYARLWAHSEAVRVQERLLQTVMKMGYMEGGDRRLEGERVREREEREKEAKAKEEAKQKERDLRFLESPMTMFQSAFHLGCFKEALDRRRDDLPVGEYLRKLEAYELRRKEVLSDYDWGRRGDEGEDASRTA